MDESTIDLLKRIRLGQDSSLELKDLRFRGDQVAEPHRHSMADEFAAMANTGSGTFVLGVDDKLKTVVGIPLDKLDVVERWLEAICHDLINPTLFCRILKLWVTSEDGDERAIIRVDVPRSLFVHQSPGGYFHRIGTSKWQMPPDVLARLFQQRSQARLIRFDEQAVPQASPEVLEPALWNRFRSRYSPAEDQDFLLKLKLMTRDDDGGICPSVGGILMTSESPQDYLPNAYIQAVAYRGTERNAAHQLDARDITGPLDRQIVEAVNFVKRNMRIQATKTPARVDIPQFSIQAVFEAIVNAVAHRDYSIHASKIRLHMFSDRLEVFSPGAFPNTMTIESLPLRQAARNELITSLLARCPIPFDEVAKDRQFIMDRRGEGVPIILTESERLSGKRPVYNLIDDTELLLTIFAHSRFALDG